MAPAILEGWAQTNAERDPLRIWLASAHCHGHLHKGLTFQEEEEETLEVVCVRNCTLEPLGTLAQAQAARFARLSSAPPYSPQEG